MMERFSAVDRKTGETDIHVRLKLDGSGVSSISTGIPFFDHMLSLFSVHGFFDLSIEAVGDVAVDYHHTVEDIGIVLGETFRQSLGDRKGIRRYGFAVTPMDDALTSVAVDVSNRPFLVCNIPKSSSDGTHFSDTLVKEFFRAFSNHAGMNIHINVLYGENGHHILESVFKAAGRAIDQACSFDDRIRGVLSSKGTL